MLNELIKQQHDNQGNQNSAKGFRIHIVYFVPLVLFKDKKTKTQSSKENRIDELLHGSYVSGSHLTDVDGIGTGQASPNSEKVTCRWLLLVNFQFQSV